MTNKLLFINIKILITSIRVKSFGPLMYCSYALSDLKAKRSQIYAMQICTFTKGGKYFLFIYKMFVN